MRSHRVGHDWSDLAVAADASSYFCEMGPKVSTTPSSQGDPGSGSSPSSDFTEMPYLPLLYPLSESSQPELRGWGNRRRWVKGVRKTVLPLSSPQELDLLRVWTDLSTWAKWLVLSDLWTEKILTEKQECSSGSVSCLLAMPEPPSTRKGDTRPSRHHSALGKPARVSTLWQREVLKRIFKDVWTDLFERQLELWSNPDVSLCLSVEGRVCLQASDL